MSCCCFKKRQFRAWWFETATPTFLVDVLTARHVFVPSLEHLITSEQLLSIFDVDHIATEALLFQTGYLTIQSVQTLGAFVRYRLRYPNLEVRASLGLDLTPEESSNAGRLDLSLRFNGQVYLFEFKVVELAPEGRALQQIKARGYAERYRARGEPIHLIGVECSRERRSVVGFEVATQG